MPRIEYVADQFGGGDEGAVRVAGGVEQVDPSGDAFQNVLRIAQERRVHMRTAAYLLSVDQVARATTTRGIYP